MDQKLSTNLNVRKPSYFVKRVSPGNYRIVTAKRTHMVTKKGRFWFMDGNYFRTMRDAVIEAI